MDVQPAVQLIQAKKRKICATRLSMLWIVAGPPQPRLRRQESSLLTRVDQDHEWDRPSGGDKFVWLIHQDSGGPSPIQVEGDIQTKI